MIKNTSNVLDHNIPIEKYFEELSLIPRNIGCEKAASDYILAFAEAHQLEAVRDDMYNVIVKKPASPGYESAPPVILQAHLDMVCVKTAESQHNFETDGLSLYVEDGWIHAKDTTLGADDGFGIAYMLAVLADTSAKHPPLECVFTVQEESGTYGAAFLDMTALKGTRYINLDGDSESTSFVSCYCSDRLILEKTFSPAPSCKTAYRLQIGEMKGSVIHGVVHQECGNAIKICSRLLSQVSDKDESLQIAALNGGTGENFIPETCTAVFFSALSPDRIKACLDEEFSAMCEEFESEDYMCSFSLNVEEDSSNETALSSADSSALLQVLLLLPNNTFQNSTQDGHLTSVNNLGILRLQDGKVRIQMSSRSKYLTATRGIRKRCRIIAELSGFTFSWEVRFSPWPYRKVSPLRQLMNQAFTQVCGRAPKEDVCPGGLEIVHFVQKMPHLDTIQIGPDINAVHTVDEKMNRASFHRVYQVLLYILAQIKEA